MNGADYRQQQERDEEQFFLWSCLNHLREYLSAETFEKAEQELGLGTDKNKLN